MNEEYEEIYYCCFSWCCCKCSYSARLGDSWARGAGSVGVASVGESTVRDAGDGGRAGLASAEVVGVWHSHCFCSCYYCSCYCYCCCYYYSDYYCCSGPLDWNLDEARKVEWIIAHRWWYEVIWVSLLIVVVVVVVEGIALSDSMWEEEDDATRNTTLNETLSLLLQWNPSTYMYIVHSWRATKLSVWWCSYHRNLLLCWSRCCCCCWQRWIWQRRRLVDRSKLNRSW